MVMCFLIYKIYPQTLTVCYQYILCDISNVDYRLTDPTLQNVLEFCMCHGSGLGGTALACYSIVQ